MELFGFIGTGNMGGALAEAVCRRLSPDGVMLSNRTRAKAEALAAKTGGRVATNEEIASSCRYIFLGVKPQGMRELFAEISPVLRARAATGGRFILVSMAAGLSAAAITELYGAEVPVVRIMPNTPVSVGAGLVLYATNSSATKEETETLVSALELAGKTHEISEAEMDAASIISGCAPAYVFMFIKALADAGVSLGLDEKSSLLYAEQTVFGSAKLAMESGKAPDELKKEVCSPGGTTIEGVKSLEKDGLAEIVHSAAEASYRRTLELAGKACGAK